MSIKASIVRDEKGFPVLADLRQGAQKIEIVFEDNLLTLTGSRRSLENQALINAARLIYPTQSRVEFNIPQPLQVQNVAGGKIIFFDDIEGLDKWTVAAGAGGQDNAIAYNGSNSLAVNGQLERYIPNVGPSFNFSLFWRNSGAVFTENQISLSQHIGNQYKRMLISEVEAGNVWRLLTTGAVYYTFATFGIQEGFWHRLEIQVRDWIYKKVIIDNKVFEVNLELSSAASAVGLGSDLNITTNIANHFDDILIVEA